MSPEVTQIEKIRIVLADDHPLMRRALKSCIDEQEDLQVIAEASDGKEVVDIVTKLSPDIVIMDISMPRLNGLEATKQIIEKCPETKILVVTFFTDQENINSIIASGARGYLSKNSSGSDIINAIRTIASGEQVIPSVQKTTDIRNTSVKQNRGNELSPRELELLKLIAAGLSNKEIADRLNLSLRRIKANITILFVKLCVSSRTEAISIGMKNGIISLDDI